MKIQGRGVLVTGASRGLGRALAAHLARMGARVVLVARNEREVTTAAEEIRAEVAKAGGGGEAHALAFDVGDKDAVYRIAGAAAALVGPPEIVVHNASTLGVESGAPLPLLLDTPCEDLEGVLAVNLVGPFRLTKALAGPLVLSGEGLFLFLSSDAAVSAYPRWGAYGVSKAALDHLTRSFASELDPLRFIAIDPGEMDTRMHADAIPDADRSTLADPADVAARIVTLVEGAEAIPSGARVSAADFPPARRPDADEAA